jgi:hypothetical protein
MKEPSVTAAPYVPIVPPKQFLAGNALASLLIVAAAVWCYVDYIPSHDPANMGVGDVVGALAGKSKGFLSAEVIQPLKTTAILVGVVGLLSLLTGSFREVGKQEFCKACAIQVVSRRKALGRFVCERCGATLSGKVGAIITIGVIISLFAGTGFVYYSFVGPSPTPRRSGGDEAQSQSPPAPSAPLTTRAPWIERAEPVLRSMVASQADTLGKSALANTHPTGKFASAQCAVKRHGNGLVLEVVVSWKGGLLGTDYATTYEWSCTEQGHVQAIVAADNATFSVDAEHLKLLDEYFRDGVWPPLSKNVGD